MDNLKLKLLSLIGLISFTIHVYGQCDKTGNLFGIPDEFVINRYSPPDKIYGHPYTIFNKRDYGAESFNLELEVDEIRRRIAYENLLIPKGNVYKAYKYVLDEANTSEPAEVSPNDPNASISPLAKWAKYNAFVLLIGLDENGDPLDLHPYEQNFADAITHMDYEGVSDMGNTIDFANSAMCWIQAYDLYKTYVILNSSTDPAQRKPSDYDRNDGDCSARNKMRQMAKELYDEGMGGIGSWGTVNHPSGWKKNHGIIAASAIGMAAIVLNDAGVETNFITGL
jgi:hypothetical protein